MLPAPRWRRVTTTALVSLVSLAALLGLRPAAAETLSAEARVAYVARALTSLHALGEARDRLETALADAARQRCGGRGSQPPRLPCLLELGQKLCRSGYGDPQACAAAADVILVNLRSAALLVDEATRVRLVRGSADYHAALLAELRARYAVLAAELVIEDPEASLASPASSSSGATSATSATEAAPLSAVALDRFCARRDARPQPPRCNQPSPTCIPSLSWQRCVAALAWFATSPPAKENAR